MLLARRWRELDPQWRLPLQGLGQQSTGCGATIGLLPRCDFDCRGCYLGRDANAAPRASPQEIFAQLESLREHLGPKGNLQLTDGEVTLLPESELLSTVAQARRLGMMPMLMTHGETLRRRAGLLERLVAAGLTEISVHVDSLQRGRRDAFAGARTEAALEPLRDEFAERIRATRRRTGVRLRAAMTLTVARSNLAELPLVLRGLLARRDAFGLVSLQPMAQVGRTRTDLEGVAVEEVWAAVSEAFAPFGFAAARRSPLHFGHPDCTRLEPLLVVERQGGMPRLLPIVRPDRPADVAIAERFLALGLGGLAFRDDSRLERICRALGAFALAPSFVLAELAVWARERAEEIDTTLARLLLDLVRGRARADSFQVISHHFMSRAEALSDKGRERLAACVFRAPIDGRMAPMCEVNALGLRDRVYARLGSQARKAP